MKLATHNLSFFYGKKVILDGVNLTFHPGTLTLLLGPNGAGKSTLLKLLSGILEPARGAVFLNDAPLADLPLRKRARKIGVMSQTPPPALDFTVAEFVMMGRFAKLPRLAPPREADREAVASALEAVRMTDFAGSRANALSGGEFERIRLAALLALQSEILLADEPTSAQDPAHALQILGLLKERSRQGAAVVGVMHDLDLAARVADRVVLLVNGKVLADGLPQEVMTAERLSAAYQTPVVRHDHDGGFHLEFHG